jgi:hypothetical protein
MGLGLRVGGFFVGSDDMMAFFSSGTQFGANVYFGLYIPFNKRDYRDGNKDDLY